MHLAARAQRTIRKHRLFPRGASVLVAFSGGPDSVALLHVLRVLEARGELVVAGLGHLNHQLRGADADSDEEACRRMAAAQGLSIEVERVDVAAEARRSGRSIEDAARAARYAFLEAAADRVGADVIAVGHSADDQAETFLLRLLRGAGARGLAGIRPRAGRVVRPLLEVPRQDLRRYIAEHGLPFLDDASNRDTRIPRNRIRHELIPHLEQFTPGIVPLLARQADLAREDELYLAGRAEELAAGLLSDSDGVLKLDAVGLRELPVALASRVVRLSLEKAAPGRFIGWPHLDQVLGLCRVREGTAVALPGHVARREGDFILLGPRPVAGDATTFRFPLSIPGEVLVPGWAVSADSSSLNGLPGLPPARGGLAVLAADRVRTPLAVRTRRPGDRFRPLGMGGHGRKLQDYLVDRKVPRAERDRLPLVVDSEDRIVWVVGQSVAEDFRVTAPERGVILLKARRLGGPG